MKRDEPKAPTAIYGPLGITFHANEKAKVIVDCLENHFTSHDLCDENLERQVEATVQALLASVEGTPLRKVRPCDIHKFANSLKLRRACGIVCIPNECLRHLPRKPLVHLTHLFTHCLRLSHFPKPSNDAQFITLAKPGKDPEFPPNLRPIRFLSTRGKSFEKVIQKIVQTLVEERGLPNASQFGFRARHSTTFQCRRLTEHVTLYFNNMSMHAVI
jgi:hypothetical protein